MEIFLTLYSISKCKDKRCKTCPRLSSTKYFYSSVTGKKHFIINPLNTNNCKSSNLVYILACDKCGVQYNGECISEVFSDALMLLDNDESVITTGGLVSTSGDSSVTNSL